MAKLKEQGIKQKQSKKAKISPVKQQKEVKVKLPAKQTKKDKKAAKSLNRRERVYKTIDRDYSKLVKLRINSKTEIYIQPNEDPEKAKQAYLKRHS